MAQALPLISLFNQVVTLTIQLGGGVGNEWAMIPEKWAKSVFVSDEESDDDGCEGKFKKAVLNNFLLQTESSGYKCYPKYYLRPSIKNADILFDMIYLGNEMRKNGYQQ